VLVQPIGASRRANGHSQRSEQRLETHRRIFEAARNLFIEKGYFDTRSTDIAKAAGCSTGSVFAHFECKAKIMTAVMAEVYERRIGLLKSTRWTACRAKERLCEIIVLLWRSNLEDKGLLRAFFSYSWFHDAEDEASYARYIAERDETILSALAETEGWQSFRARPDFELACQLLQAQYVNLLRQASFFPPAQLEQRLLDTVDCLFPD
jgi:AcrR family transcriptional regulator